MGYKLNAISYKIIIGTIQKNNKWVKISPTEIKEEEKERIIKIISDRKSVHICTEHRSFQIFNVKYVHIYETSIF